MTKTDFLQELSESSSKYDLSILGRAYDFARKVHEGQNRESGLPFFTHCEQVARILGVLQLDTTTVAAGLLHDTVEDGGVSLQELEEDFGLDTASLVDGVSKMKGVTFESREKKQAENFRKMLLSMSGDVRVILIKLADRLHNMRTISYLRPEKRKRIAQETLDIYAPLAHRFGIARIEWELEDLAFEQLYPEEFQALKEQVAESRDERERYIQEIIEPLRKALAEENIHAEITGRPKHLYSIRNKMVIRGVRLGEIYDLLAIRIITKSVPECYHAMGTIHKNFAPVSDRIKDYIAVPKSNMYQSLHTTVIGPRGDPVEIQIRTEEMHRTAEMGIAAHWLYKEGKTASDEPIEQLAWLRQLLEWQRDEVDPKEFMDSLKIELYHEEIFVFTPAGDLKRLPKGSTPVDFAYAVHTEIGDHCVGARVNNKLTPLKQPLKSGDTVEIVTSSSTRPNRDWLGFVATNKARAKIRQFIRTEERLQSINLGKKIVEREIRRLGLKMKKVPLDDVAMSLGYNDSESMTAALGSGELSTDQFTRRLSSEKGRAHESEAEHESRVSRFVRKVRRHPAGVTIDNIDDLLIEFAKCCQPLPGDRIVGIVTRGRGVTVHRIDCPNTFAPHVEPERKIAVDWSLEKDHLFAVQIEVESRNRMGLLADISKVISEYDVDITSAEIAEDGPNWARGSFSMLVKNLRQLERIITSVRKIKGVSSVRRTGYGQRLS
jgi:GTP pyrophosphokinase